MDLNSGSPSFELLLLSVREDENDAAKKRAEKIIAQTPVDWNDLFDRATAHCIRPQLERFLEKISLPLIPGSFKERLSDKNRENLLRQLRSLSVFFRIKQIFDNQNITVIPFKGFWLAEAMYGNMADREAFDVDLFIDIKDLQAIKSIMLAEGFTNTSSITRLTDEFIANELSEYNFEKYENDIRVFHYEFHWRSSMNLFRMDIRLSDLRSQIIPGIIQGHELQVFSPAANLLLTLMHHGGKEQLVLLKQVLDIARIIEKHESIDWSWLMNEVHRYGLDKVLFIGVRLANMVTGVEIPLIIREETCNASITRIAEGRMKMMETPVSDMLKFKFRMKGWLFHIRSRNGFGLKLHLLWHFIRKVLMPEIIPANFHHLFYNKKIRRK